MLLGPFFKSYLALPATYQPYWFTITVSIMKVPLNLDTYLSIGLDNNLHRFHSSLDLKDSSYLRSFVVLLLKATVEKLVACKTITEMLILPQFSCM